jgi:CRISPR-associated protein Cas1
VFSDLLKGTKGGMKFDFTNRNRRPPRDPVNALLSFVYAMLVKDLTVILSSVGFDPYLGVFHRPRYGRPALALDLAEEFRPLIGDSVVLGLINNQEVGHDDFVERVGSVAMSKAARKRLISAYERRMDTLIRHPVFGYTVSYRRIMEVQARLLGRVFTGEIPAYQPFCTR